MRKENNYELAARGIKVGGFSVRLFLYLVIYAPITIMWVWITTANGLDDYNSWGGYGAVDRSTLSFIIISIMILPTSIPFIFWEISIRKWRRKHGLSVWGNIEEALKQMAVDEQVTREQKALKKYKEKQK